MQQNASICNTIIVSTAGGRLRNETLGRRVQARFALRFWYQFADSGEGNSVFRSDVEFIELSEAGNLIVNH
jgi:hypothetical protein